MADEQDTKQNEQVGQTAPAAAGQDVSGGETAQASGDSRDRGGARGRGRNDRGGDRGGDRKRRRRDESSAPSDGIQEALIPGGIFKCSKVVKGGRRFSFAALVAVGDGRGTVGYGYGKAKEVPIAIQKAITVAKREMVSFPIHGDGTIPHEVHGWFGAAHVVLVPAGPGTGIIAGATVKTVLELGGLSNVLTKSFGSSNRKNLVKATFDALLNLRNRTAMEALRGVSIS